MAGLDERLDRLFSNQDGTKNVLDMVQALLQKQDTDGTTSPTPTNKEAPAFSSSIGTPTENTTVNTDTLTASALTMMLPQLMQVMSGEADLIKQERVALLKAMRPYMKENRLPNLDRALRLANMTKAAASAMKLLGR